jgi:hypothetical protein
MEHLLQALHCVDAPVYRLLVIVRVIETIRSNASYEYYNCKLQSITLCSMHSAEMNCATLKSSIAQVRTDFGCDYCLTSCIFRFNAVEPNK